LFCRLLRAFEVTTVCDVGSMDGRDALRFRRALPRADIIALEPNPRNFALMQADPQLALGRIRIMPLAASDRDSDAPFFVVEADYVRTRNPGRRGMSSLHRRSDGSRLSEVVQVRTMRLDGMLLSDDCARDRLALWIDTEGMAFETISGAARILDRTLLIHVEVETVPCIGAAQRLFPDVEKMLHDAGFCLLATDYPVSVPQFNALFVRAEALEQKAAETGWHIACERLHRGTKHAVRPLVPPRLRRFLARGLGALRRP